MSEIKFPSPAERIIAEFEPKNKFRIDTSLPDLSFLRQLSIQGRLRYFQHDLSSSDLTITPNVGETFFLFRILAGNASATLPAVWTITNAGMQRLNALLPILAASAPNFTYDIFDSLVGNGTDSIIFAQAQGTVRISVFGWVENTSRIRDVAA